MKNTNMKWEQDVIWKMEKNSDSIDGIEGGQNGEWQDLEVEIVRAKDESDEFGEEELDFFDELMMLYA